MNQWLALTGFETILGSRTANSAMGPNEIGLQDALCFPSSCSEVFAGLAKKCNRFDCLGFCCSFKKYLYYKNVLFFLLIFEDKINQKTYKFFKCIMAI